MKKDQQIKDLNAEIKKMKDAQKKKELADLEKELAEIKNGSNGRSAGNVICPVPGPNVTMPEGCVLVLLL